MFISKRGFFLGLGNDLNSFDASDGMLRLSHLKFSIQNRFICLVKHLSADDSREISTIFWICKDEQRLRMPSAAISQSHYFHR